MSESERNILLHWITQTTEEPISKISKEILLADKEEVIKVVANNSNIIKEMEFKAEKRGEVKGKVEILTKLLLKKISVLPNEYQEKLNKLNEETLENITLDIFDINDLSDLDKYFK